jgi:hypothetical protein
MSPTAAFIDTNVWLHYRPVNEIDWRSLLGAEAVEIVVLPIVVAELDKQKDHGRTHRIRDRARGALTQIEAWQSTGVSRIRDGVDGAYRELHPPRELFDELGLDAIRADDVLVAAVIAFHRQHPDLATVLVTGDVGPRMKARARGMTALGPSEEDRLPGQMDDVEKENAALRRRLDELVNRLPKLSLVFLDGPDGGTRLEIDRPRPAEQPLDEWVTTAVQRAQNEVPDVLPSPPPGAREESALDLGPLQMGLCPPWEYERYSRERLEYLDEVRDFAAAQWHADDLHRRSIDVQLIIRNDGNGPAEDVSLWLYVPDGPTIGEDDGVTNSPIERPKRPRPPQTNWQIIQDGLQRFQLPLMPREFYMGESLADVIRRPRANASPLRVRRSNSFEIEADYRRVKQHQHEIVEPIVLVFPTIADMQSLTLQYRLNSASLPRPCAGKLHIVLR